MSLAADAPRRRRPGPGLAVSIIVIVIASVIGITGFAVGIAKGIHRVTHFEDGPQAVLPAQISANLTPATWQVYEKQDEAFVLGAGNVSVVGPDGAQVPVRGLPENLTETVNGYDAFARFDVSRAGSYTISVQAEPAEDGTPILVGETFGSEFHGLAKWFVMAGLGFLLGCAGLVMLIVGIVRRRTLRRGRAYPGVVGPPSTGPPVGWYDDPHLPGLQRYWDGTRWTDQTRNSS